MFSPLPKQCRGTSWNTLGLGPSLLWPLCRSQPESLVLCASLFPLPAGAEGAGVAEVGCEEVLGHSLRSFL